MGSNSLLLKREGGLFVAVINRPEKLNALNNDVLRELNEFLDVLETDKGARALILTGSGEKAFCVGPDLKERQGMDKKATLQRLTFVRELYLRLESLSLAVIAAIEGIALGEGFELALACDLRVASDNAVMGLPEVDLAIIPGNGGTQRLIRMVGMGRTLEMILLARKLSGEEAFRFGLINKVTPPGKSMEQAREWARKMMESGPIAIEQAKKAIRSGFHRSLEEGLKLEADAYKRCLETRDRLEGLKAFVEKRAPVYSGN